MRSSFLQKVVVVCGFFACLWLGLGRIFWFASSLVGVVVSFATLLFDFSVVCCFGVVSSSLERNSVFSVVPLSHCSLTRFRNQSKKILDLAAWCSVRTYGQYLPSSGHSRRLSFLIPYSLSLTSHPKQFYSVTQTYNIRNTESGKPSQSNAWTVR